MHGEIENNLRQLEHSLQKRLEDVKAGLIQEHSADSKEQAIERENDEVLLKIEESVATELAQVRNALKRLSAGEYGICEECGEQIALPRLKAMPFATLCVACAEARE
jgi:RNA polymerase-binding protein DksA